MATINDAKKAALVDLGYDGTIDEAYHNYLVAETGENLPATQDLEKLLFSELGYVGSLQDMWFEFLRDNGFTNSLQDMLYAFWNSDGAGLSPLYFSEFYAKLTHSLALDRGTGSPTFTRATTATVSDNEGILRQAIAGEARFVGARRVYNQVSASENLAAFTQTNCTYTKNLTGPDNVANSAGTLTATGANALFYKTLPVIIGRTVFSVQVKRLSGTGSIFISNDGANTFTDVTSQVASGWIRVSSVQTLAVANFPVIKIATSGDSIGIGQWQFEDITGRTDQTTPSEYVSVGALDYRSTQDPLYLGQSDATAYAGTPDSSAASVTGDIDIRVKVSLNDWTPATDSYLVAKLVTSGQYSYDFRVVATTGILALRVSTNGTALKAANSSAAPTITDGQPLWVRCTRAATSGDTYFYQSSDGSTWTQVGTVIATTAGGIFDGTDGLSVGGSNGAGVAVIGKIFSAQIYNTIGGTTPVVDFNPQRDALTPTGTITSSTTGEVWTINGASSVVRNAAYHGAGVDGVKCFNTDLSGNPLPTSHTYDAVSLNGVAGTYVSTPDSVANSITGDIDIRVKAKPTLWAGLAATSDIISKWNVGGNTFLLRTQTNGQLTFYTSVGAVTGNVSSSVSISTVFSTGDTGWLRVTKVSTTGVVAFYTSADGIIWTPLGVPQAGTAGTLDNNTAEVQISGYNGSGDWAAQVYQAQIYNGINGTLAVDFNASRYAGGTTLTGSTGETWTLQGNAVIHPTNYPNLGYLAEAAATNLCLQSNALTTAPWANQVGTCTPTQNATGPDGATSAWTLTDNDAGATEVYGALIGTLTAASYTTSIFVAKTSGAQSSYPVVLMYDGTALRIAVATIDTTNGVATVWTSYTGWTAVGTAACESYNDEFWRVSLTFTASTNVWVINLVPAGSLTATLAGPAFDAAAQGSAGFFGVQVELGSFATSYIPTTTVAVTRNADVLTYPSAGNIDGAVGWCSAEAAFNDVARLAGLAANVVGTTTAGRLIEVDSSTSIRCIDAAVNLAAKTLATPLSSTPAKLTSSWGADGMKITGSGETPATQATFTSMTLTGGIGIMCRNDGTTQPNGTIRQVRIGQRQLSSSELQAITS